DRRPVYTEHDIARLNAGSLCGAVRPDIRHHDTGMVFQAERRGEHRRDVLRDHTNRSTADVAVLPKMLIYIANDIAWDREADALAPTRLRQDHRVDTRNVALDIKERTAAVAGVNRSVSLNVEQRTIPSPVPDGCTDEADGERV